MLSAGSEVVAESASTGCLSSMSDISRRSCASTASTTTMSDRIGAATYVHQPLVAIRSLRLAGGSSGVLALAVYSVRTALLRDVIFKPHTSFGPRATQFLRTVGQRRR